MMVIYKKIAFISLTVLTLIFLTACDEDESGLHEINSVIISESEHLDFTPVSAYGAGNSRTISEQWVSTAAGTQAAVPLRAFDQFYINYYTSPALNDYEAADAALLATSSNEELRVIDYSPQGPLPARVSYPQVMLMFNHPIVSLQALGAEITAVQGITINPPIRGRWRYLTSSLLVFESDEAVIAQHRYTVTVNQGFRALNGRTLQDNFSFNFTTEELAMTGMQVGFGYTGTARSFSNSNVPLPIARYLRLSFNYDVPASFIRQFIDIRDGARTLSYQISNVDSRNVAIVLNNPPPANSQIRVVLREGARSQANFLGRSSEQSYSFNTLQPLRNLSVSTQNRFTAAEGLNPIYLRFNNPINAASIREAISFVPAKPLNDNNITVRGNTIILHDLPINIGERFTINVSQNLRDIDGQPLNAALSVQLEGARPFPELHMSAEGVGMLEASYTPRIVMALQNMQSGRYRIGQAFNPYAHITLTGNTGEPITGLEVKNTPIFKDFNLSSFVNAEGFGWVYFAAQLQSDSFRYSWSDRDEVITYDRSVNVQVTNIGITARYGYNRIAAMVAALDTGLPLEGAVVKAYAFDSGWSWGLRNRGNIDIFRNHPPLAEAVVDSNGLATLPLGEELYRSSIRGRTLFLLVENGSDRAFYALRGHNQWANGVWSRGADAVLDPQQRTFVFSDRRLYRAGETLSFRGLDRTLHFGEFTPYSGGYTIELFDPRNVRIAGSEGTTSDTGGFWGSFTLSEEAENGYYQLVYRRSTPGANRIFTELEVAAFANARYQIAVSAPPVIFFKGDNVLSSVTASYLAGGVLSGAPYRVSWSALPTAFRSSNFRDYRFGPLNFAANSRSLSQRNGTLNGLGEASESLPTESNFGIIGVPYNLTAQFIITDAAGQQLSGQTSLMLHPARFYIGLRRASGQSPFVRVNDNFRIDYSTVLPNDERAVGVRMLQQDRRTAGLNWELYRVEWKLANQQSGDDRIHSRWERTEVKVSEGALTAGSGSFTVRPDAAGSYFVRVQSFDEFGALAVTELSFFATGSNFSGFFADSATALNISSDKEVYLPGERAQLLLQSPLPRGRYLVTIEREGIFHEYITELEGEANVIEIPIALEYVPVVYVSISSYSVRTRPADNSFGGIDLDKPMGYYGVTALFVDPYTLSFDLDIQTDKQFYRPGEEVTLEVTARRGQRPLAGTELTLMVVDRGVLDVAGYRVPDPIQFFYNISNFPLYTGGGDSRDLLFDPVTYDVKTLAGGDAEEDDDKMATRRDFNPTALFEPSIVTDSEGKVQVTFTLPDNLTLYRITVVGANDNLFAKAESEIGVRNPINAQVVKPLRMRERDTGEVGLMLTNLSGTTQEVTVSLQLRDGSRITNDGLRVNNATARIDDETSKRISLPNGESRLVPFNLAALNEGETVLSFRLQSVPLNEIIEVPLIIERPVVYETVAFIGQLDSTTNRSEEHIVIPGFAFRNDGFIELSLDATRLAMLRESARYLFRYPFGCLEQRSSALLPLIIFGRYIDTLGLASEIDNPRQVVESELRRFAGFQRNDGGFPFWPDGRVTNSFVSIRIAHILAYADEEGFDYPINKNSLLNFTRAIAQNLRESRYLRSYAAYVLALHGEPLAVSALQNLLTDADSGSAVLIGLAAAYGGQNDLAETILRDLRRFIQFDGRGVSFTNPDGHDNRVFWGSNLERLIQIAHLQVLVDSNDQLLTRLIFTIMLQQRAGVWHNTFVTAQFFETIRAIIKADNLENLNLTATTSLNNNNILSGNFRGLAAQPLIRRMPFNEAPLANLPRNTVLPLTINKEGNFPLYYTVMMQYALPNELVRARDEGFGLFARITDIDSGEVISNGQLEGGRIYRLDVTL
ncbi:MAG: MG2 domain-containing protein, partial [Spirochaetaceae bacterium]|nr:MG2 domain-containing protein [Spirochaetaceae bacterium]